MTEPLEPVQINQIQVSPNPVQQGEFDIVVITPWLYKLVIKADHENGVLKYRNSQKITYWCYYYIHPIYGQIQVRLSVALAHLKAYQLLGGVGWQLPDQAPSVPLQPLVPFVISGKPNRRIGR